MLRLMFLHTVKDEICVLNSDEIAFFGPADWAPIVKAAVTRDLDNGQKEIVEPAVMGDKIEICQIHTKNKSIFNIRENFKTVLDMSLMWGAMITEEAEGLVMQTKIQQPGPPQEINRGPRSASPFKGFEK